MPLDLSAGVPRARQRDSDIIRATCQIREPLTGSEWADRYRMISEGQPEPGQWRTSRAPYLGEIMDACTDPDVERIVFMKSARVGGTSVAENVIGYYTDHVPSQMLIVQPTQEDAEDFSKEHLEPMIRDTPVLGRKVWRSAGRRDARETIKKKTFPGGFIALVGSNSAAGFRRRNIQRVILEEVDGYPIAARGSSRASEGDPITLAIKRSQNYDDRTIFENSTPTLKGLSRIERDYNISDQRRYRVPCPHCGFMQVLKWRNLQWDDNDSRTTRYICGEISKEGELVEGCGKPIHEHHKPAMLAGGEWVAERPGRPIVGFHIWAGYSPFTTWARLVEEWLNAQGNAEQLKVFVNQVLGETWEERGEEIEDDALLARRAEYDAEVPDGVGILTMGVDVQGDRLEATVWGWGVGFQCWLIRHEVFWGDPGHADVWAQLDLFRVRPFLGTSRKMRIRCVAVDSGGHHTDQVYRFTRPRQRDRVFAIKGSSTPGSAPVGRPTQGNRAKARLFSLGTEALKDTIFSWLKNTVTGPGYVNFPHVDDEIIRQITSEKAVTRFHLGRPVRRYVKRSDRMRGEALDCFVYALGALYILGPAVYEHIAKWVATKTPTGDGSETEEDETDKAKRAGRGRRGKRGKWVDRWKR